MASFLKKWIDRQKERPYWMVLSIFGHALMLLAVLAFFSGQGAFIYEGF